MYTTKRGHFQMQRSSPPGERPATSIFLSQAVRHIRETQYWSATSQGPVISSSVCKAGKIQIILGSLDLSPVWREATGAGDEIKIVWSDGRALKAPDAAWRRRLSTCTKGSWENAAKMLLCQPRWRMMDQEPPEEELTGLADTLEAESKEKNQRWFVASGCCFV